MGVGRGSYGDGRGSYGGGEGLIWWWGGAHTVVLLFGTLWSTTPKCSGVVCSVKKIHLCYFDVICCTYINPQASFSRTMFNGTVGYI